MLILMSWHEKVVKTTSLVLVLRICGNLKSWQNNGYADISTWVVASQTSSLGYARDRDQSAGADVLILMSWHKKVVKTSSLVLVLRICGNLKS